MSVIHVATIYCEQYNHMLNESEVETSFICMRVFLYDKEKPEKMAENYVINISTTCVSVTCHHNFVHVIVCVITWYVKYIVYVIYVWLSYNKCHIEPSIGQKFDDEFHVHSSKPKLEMSALPSGGQTTEKRWSTLRFLWLCY